MAEVRAAGTEPATGQGDPRGQGGQRGDSAAIPQPTQQDQTLALRLTPVNNSDQPVLANTSNVQLAPGMAFIDFGFIEPGLLAALPRVAQQGGQLPKEINGRLAVRVAMGYDGLAQLQQQLTRVMGELAKLTEVAKRQSGGNA